MCIYLYKAPRLALPKHSSTAASRQRDTATAAIPHVPQGRWLLLAAFTTIVTLTEMSTSVAAATDDYLGSADVVLDRLHDRSRKVRPSLQLHAQLRQICEGTRAVEADKLMIKYRADPIRFHRQGADDWNRLLLAARARCCPDSLALRVDSTHRNDGHFASEGELPHVDAYKDSDRRQARTHATSAKPESVCTPSRLQTHEVEDQLRTMLMKVVRNHISGGSRLIAQRHRISIEQEHRMHIERHPYTQPILWAQS